MLTMLSGLWLLRGWGGGGGVSGKSIKNDKIAMKIFFEIMWI